MKLLRRLIVAILVLGQLMAPLGYADASIPGENAQPTVTVTSPPTEPLPTAPLVITAYMVDTLPVFVQIYNNSSTIVELDSYVLSFCLDGGEPVPINLHGFVIPKGYVVVSRDGMVADADLGFQISGSVPDTTKVTALQLNLAGSVPLITPTLDQVLPNQIYTLNDIGSASKRKYDVSTQDTTVEGHGYYDYADSTGLRITEFVANAANCAPLDTSAHCSDFVEIQNRSDGPIDLAAYRLRLGYGNASISVTNNIPLTGELATDGYVVISTRSDGKPLDLTASGGNVWLEDTYGLHVYAETIVNYPDLSATEDKGLSFAYDDSDNTWKVATTVTPGNTNDFSAPDIEPGRGGVSAEDSTSNLKPCASNQYRNSETNRCNLIVTTVTSPKPCAAGQYRSVETHRCRSLEVATMSSLTPCNANQFRNPETGRCKLLASETSTQLKPCAEGQERNPDTNRCRKVAASTIPSADFPVETVAETAKSFVGWYALGGVLLLGAGYGVFEWRQEIARVIQKAATVVRRK